MIPNQQVYAITGRQALKSTHFNCIRRRRSKFGAIMVHIT